MTSPCTLFADTEDSGIVQTRFRPIEGREHQYVSQLGRLFADPVARDCLRRYSYLFRFGLPSDESGSTGLRAAQLLAKECGVLDGPSEQADLDWHACSDLLQVVLRRAASEPAARLMSFTAIAKWLPLVARGDAVLLHDPYLLTNVDDFCGKLIPMLREFKKAGVQGLGLLTVGSLARDSQRTGVPRGRLDRAALHGLSNDLAERLGEVGLGRMWLQTYAQHHKARNSEFTHSRWVLTLRAGMWVDTGFAGHHDKTFSAFPVDTELLEQMYLWTERIRNECRAWRFPLSGPANS